MVNCIRFLMILSLIFISCKEDKSTSVKEIKETTNEKNISAEEMSKQLQEDGFKTFTYKEGDTTYLMQQYYMVFLKAGPNRDQDSLSLAKLQQQHMAHLERMAVEGYASLIGPFEDSSDVKGIAVYNTRTLKEADSLANLDPMVKAGRLIIEVHPWWTAKGNKLN
ncbi:hypothetical protein IIF7_13402 [Zunongwangia atlantica 22II14-10F7]|uniref:YCII-related domain-containing protein n=2 Tax=Zunongwangia TaxID=417127 RepID=A0A1Y1T2I9_9FLAO|nr:hypothetical protein IIF7_13402 [Zunongwangia atlantica 22II14-10F7]